MLFIPSQHIALSHGSAGCRCHQLQLFCCFNVTLHMKRTTGDLLFFCDVTPENLGFITNYSTPTSSLKSLYRFLIFLMIHLCTIILMFIFLLKNIFNDFCITVISIKTVYNHFSLFEPHTHVTHLYNYCRNMCYC